MLRSLSPGVGLPASLCPHRRPDEYEPGRRSGRDQALHIPGGDNAIAMLSGGPIESYVLQSNHSSQGPTTIALIPRGWNLRS